MTGSTAGRTTAGRATAAPDVAWLTRPEQLRAVLGIDFTDAQLAAACAPLAPGVIVAGAGSGKTAVMAARVVWLVGSAALRAEQVLGLTFTTKAAGELSARITAALDRAAQASPPGRSPGQPTGPAAQATGPVSRPVAAAESALLEAEARTEGEPVVSTYHAFAARLYAEHALRLGLEPGARLLADATRFQLAAKVLREHRGPLPLLTDTMRNLTRYVVELEGQLSDHLCPPERLRAHDEVWVGQLEAAAALAAERGGRIKGHLDDLALMATAGRKRQQLSQLTAEFRAAKRAANAVDFGDHVACGALLAENHPAVGAALRAEFRIVLLDEYQDTSVAQRRMLAGLFGGGHPVTAVGDPCQAIYAFRGASASNLDTFPTDFAHADGRPAHSFSLSVNQRSGGRLLALANRLTDGIRARLRVQELTPPPERVELGDTVLALHRTYPQEMAWLAARIKAVVDSGVAEPGECAVLVRARSDFPAARDALVAAGLPVEVVGLSGLLELPEVRDLVATLAIIADPTANAALVRLLTGPRWRIGLRDLAKLGTSARALVREGRDAAPSTEVGAADAVAAAAAGVDPADMVALADALRQPGPRVSAEAGRRLAALEHELVELRRHSDEPLLDLVQRVLATTGLGIEIRLADAADGGRRAASIDALLDLVATFTDLEGQSSLTAFLAYLDTAEEQDRGLESATPAAADSVRIMTVHKAKGLEWDVVALPNLTRKVFPVARLDGLWTRTAQVLPSPLRGDVADLEALDGLTRDDLKAFRSGCEAAQEREERRLAYVAFTRPRKLLIASAHWWGPTQKTPRGPSPYLAELYEHARHAEVACWEEPPGDEERNPVVAGQEAAVWPPRPDDLRLARRVEAARQVAAAAARDVSPAEGEDDDGGSSADPGLSAAEAGELARLDVALALLVEAELADRSATREVPLPERLSASQLVTLGSDPGRLARSLGRPLPHRPVPAARRGTRFHAWVETLWDQVPLLDADELTGAVDDELGDAELAQLKAAFLAGEFAARKPFALEAPFSLPLGGRVVIGRIDAVYDVGGGRFEVVDWKTGAESADAIQLAVYRLAWARLQGVEPAAVDAAFVYVATGRVTRPDLLDETELMSMLSRPLDQVPSPPSRQASRSRTSAR